MSMIRQTTSTSLLASLGIAIASSTMASLPAQAYSFTQGFDGYFGSTNGNGTGSSATIGWTFSDTADGFLGLTLDIANTTNGTSLVDGFTTGTDSTSKLMAFGFDSVSGNMLDLFSIESYTGNNYFANLLLPTVTTRTRRGVTTTTTNYDNLNIQGNSQYGDSYGDFDFGISNSDDLMGNGKPTRALSQGQSTSVSFKLNLNDSQWTSLLGTTSYTSAEVGNYFKTQFDGGDFRAAARFKEVGKNNSDKLFGGILPEAIDETPVDETPVDETPVDETPVDETPVDGTPGGGGNEGDGDIWSTPVSDPTPTPVGVPEPSSVLALMGLMGFSASRRRKS
jgi:hypothetical protein